MSPILLYNLVISLIVTFQYFTQAYTMTNGRGDPNNATLFINLDLFREAFVFNRMGYGAAIAWLLFVIVLVLTARPLRLRPEARLLRRRRAMTAPRRRPRLRSFSDRGPVARSYRQVPRPRRRSRCSRSSSSSAFLLPLLYMVTTAFQQPGQRTTPGAPLYPAAPVTGDLPGRGVPDLRGPDRRRRRGT